MNRWLANGNMALRTAVCKALHAVVPAALALLSAGPAMAGPEQGAVVQGAATLDASLPGTLNIHQSTDRAVINWRSFSIGANETVNFNQPSSASATLNRVLGGQRSLIDGALNANGHVYLLNSSGVLFGAGARVDVGGLVATTSALRDEDFMQDRLQFSAAALPGASIENLGTLSIRDGGIAALVAPSVVNQGVIAATLGRIGLGAGEVFTLDLYGDQLINFEVPAAASEALAAREINQSGVITAAGGRVLLTTDAASGVVDGVVNMSGVIRARSIQQSASGEIELLGGDARVNVSGTLDASGADGGNVTVVGESVSLTDTAIVDVSGSDGNGGNVFVWGDEVTRFAGTILARGGVAGDGGFVEVSAGEVLRFLGAVHADAANGRGGTLLLDPENITIEPAGGTDFAGSSISGAAVRTMLRQGMTVRLLADNTITVNDLIDGRPVEGAAISGAVDLQAGSILVIKPIITHNAAITLTATQGAITFQGEAFALVANTAATNGVGTANVTLSATQNITAGHIVSLGRVNITSSAGSVQLTQALNGLQAGAGVTGIGELSVTAGQAITTAGAISSGAVTLNAGSTLSTTGLVRANGPITFSAAGNAATAISVAAVGEARNAAIQSTGDITLNTAGGVSLAGGVLSQGGNITVGSTTSRVGSLTMAAGTALQSAAAADQDGDILLYLGSAAFTARDLIAGTSGDVRVDALGDVTLDQRLFGLEGSSGIGSLTVNAAGNIVTHGARTSGAIAITSSGGNLENAGFSLISSGGAVNLTANGPVVLREITRAGTVVAAVEAADNVTIATPGAVSIESGLLSHGDNVIVGSSGQRVASLSIAANAALQTADSADQDGDILIFVGNSPLTARDLIAGTSGDIVINALGAVTFANRVIGLAGAEAVGSLSVDAAGVTLNGVDATRDITIATSGPVSIAGSVRSRGGDIRIGASGRRVAALSMATGSALQTADAADQDGDILIYAGATAFTARDLIAGTSGDVLIDSAGAVTLANRLFGLQNSIGIGSLTVNAAGNIALNGARTDRALRINSSAGSITNSTASLISNTAGIEMQASGPVTINPILSGSSIAWGLDAQGDIGIATGAAVLLNSSVRSRGGDVRIGATTPVASLTTASGTTLRSDAIDGEIVIRAGGRVGLGTSGSTAVDIVTGATPASNLEQSILAGNRGLVDISGQDVDVRGSISGSVGSTVGVGQVLIDGSRSVSVHGISVSGFRAAPGSTTATAANAGLRLLTNDGTGRIDILGALSSGAPVYIGGRLDDVDPSFGATNTRINLANNIFTRGQAVTLSGDVTLFDAITRWDIQCDIVGCGTSYRNFDDALFSLLSAGDTPRTVELLSPPLLTYYQLDPDSFAAACEGCTINKEYLLAGQIVVCTVGTANCRESIARNSLLTDRHLYLLARNDIQAVGDNSAVLAEFDTGAGGCQYFVCARSLDGFYDDQVNPALQIEIDRGKERVKRMDQLFSGLTATIDTTDGLTGAGGGRVVVNGNIERASKDLLGLSIPTSTPGGVTRVHPTFVSHTLRIDAGTSSIEVAGTIGDDSSDNLAVEASLTALTQSANQRELLLGTFSVDLTAASISVSEDRPLYADSFVDQLETHGTSIAGQDPRERPFGEIQYDVEHTTADSSGVHQGGAAQPPGYTAPVFVPAVGDGSAGSAGGSTGPVAGGNGSGTSAVPTLTNSLGFGGIPPPVVDPSGGGSGPTTPGTPGTPGGTPGTPVNPGTDPGTPTTPAPGNPTTPADPAPGGGEVPRDANGAPISSVAEDASRKEADDETTDESLDRSDECPRGPAVLADTGRVRSVEGSAPDVFEKCKE